MLYNFPSRIKPIHFLFPLFVFFLGVFRSLVIYRYSHKFFVYKYFGRMGLNVLYTPWFWYTLLPCTQATWIQSVAERFRLMWFVYKCTPAHMCRVKNDACGHTCILKLLYTWLSSVHSFILVFDCSSTLFLPVICSFAHRRYSPPSVRGEPYSFKHFSGCS